MSPETQARIAHLEHEIEALLNQNRQTPPEATKSPRIKKIRAERAKIEEIRTRIPSAHLFRFRSGHVIYEVNCTGIPYAVKYQEVM